FLISAVIKGLMWRHESSVSERETFCFLPKLCFLASVLFPKMGFIPDSLLHTCNGIHIRDFVAHTHTHTHTHAYTHAMEFISETLLHTHTRALTHTQWNSYQTLC